MRNVKTRCVLILPNIEIRELWVMEIQIISKIKAFGSLSFRPLNMVLGSLVGGTNEIQHLAALEIREWIELCPKTQLFMGVFFYFYFLSCPEVDWRLWG